MKFVLLIHLKLYIHVLTIANSFWLNIAENENFSANNLLAEKISFSAELSTISFITLGLISNGSFRSSLIYLSVMLYI